VRQISFSATGERPLKVTSLLWSGRYEGLLVVVLTLMIFVAGVAIRKTSPSRQILEHQLATGWSMLYPHAEMKGYLVQGLRTQGNLEAKSHSFLGQQ
jgi:hypothetical protein